MILLRHAQSLFNVTYSTTRIDPGIRDPALTAHGQAQAKAVAGMLKRMSVTRISSSPYTRALETSEIVVAALGVPVTIEPLVGERAGFACDIGTPRNELIHRWPQFALDHLADQWWPEFEETESALHERCRKFQQMMATLPDWDRIAVISHWGFIRGLTGLSIQNAEMITFNPINGVTSDPESRR